MLLNLSMSVLRDRRRILLLTLRINLLLFCYSPWFFDDVRGSRSKLICLNSPNIRSEIL